jgi:ATP-binding cassette subfamily B (MDR/TAP) protein 1
VHKNNSAVEIDCVILNANQSAKPDTVQYNPGEIFIDSHNIKDLDLKFLRSNIGAVYQEPSLFTGTIKDNLKLGKMDADDEEIQKAAVMSNAHSFISQLPNQYLTEVSYSISMSFLSA